MVDPVGFINSWIVGRHFYKKGSEDLAEAKEELKDYVDKALKRTIDPLLKRASPEQREAIMSTVENSTAAIVHTYMATIVGPSTVGSTEPSGAPNVIDPSTGPSNEYPENERSV